jgi:hypothetical protein
MNQRPPAPIGNFVHMMVGIFHPMVECVLTIVHFFNVDHFLGLALFFFFGLRFFFPTLTSPA